MYIFGFIVIALLIIVLITSYQDADVIYENEEPVNILGELYELTFESDWHKFYRNDFTRSMEFKDHACYFVVCIHSTHPEHVEKERYFLMDDWNGKGVIHFDIPASQKDKFIEVATTYRENYLEYISKA